MRQVYKEFKKLLGYSDLDNDSTKKSEDLKEKQRIRKLIAFENEQFSKRPETVLRHIHDSEFRKRHTCPLCKNNAFAKHYKHLGLKDLNEYPNKQVHEKIISDFTSAKGDDDKDVEFSKNLSPFKNEKFPSTKSKNFNSYVYSFIKDKDKPGERDSVVSSFELNESIVEDKKILFNYNEIYDFAAKKNNTNDYPLIDMINYKKALEIITEKDFEKEPEKEENIFKKEIHNLLNNISLSYELLLNFIHLIQERSIESIEEDNTDYPYTSVVVLENEMVMEPRRYLNKTFMKYERVIIPIKMNYWGVVLLIPESKECYYYTCSKSVIECEVLEEIVLCIDNKVDSWGFHHINVFSAVSLNQNLIFPLIIIDFLSRACKVPSFTNEDILYYMILIGIELINQRIFTY